MAKAPPSRKPRLRKKAAKPPPRCKQLTEELISNAPTIQNQAEQSVVILREAERVYGSDRITADQARCSRPANVFMAEAMQVLATPEPIARPRRARTRAPKTFAGMSYEEFAALAATDNAPPQAWFEEDVRGLPRATR